MPTTTLALPRDTFAYQAKPTTIFYSSPSLRLQTGGTGNSYAYLMVEGFPVSADTVIASAVLELHTSNTWSGSSTLTGRRVTSAKAFTALNYTYQPSNTATGAVTASLGALSAGALIQLDVTSLVAAWAAGTANYGLRLDLTGTAARTIYSANAPDPDMRPRLVITAYKKPAVPGGASPDNNQQVSIGLPTLSWVPPASTFEAQVSYQVQTNATNVWTSPTYDSGEIASTIGQHTLTSTLSNGSTLWWRFRVKNAGLQWSDWSDGMQFGRTNKPTFSITSPSGTVNDSTPLVQWSALSAGTQVSYRVEYLAGSTVVEDSGVQPGTTTLFTDPTPVDYTAGSPSVRVSVLDNVDRATTPGDDPWIVQTASYSYAAGATTPVSSLTVTQGDPAFSNDLNWTRSTPPDDYEIVRKTNPGTSSEKSVVLWSANSGDGVDLLVSGTTYKFTDYTAPARTPLRYIVRASNNKINSSDVTVDYTGTPPYIWLMDPADKTWWIALADQQEAALTLGDDSEVSVIHGASQQQLVVDALRGYEGTISGTIYEGLPGVSGLSAQQIRDRIWHLKRYPIRTYRLAMGDLNIPVVVRNVNVVPQPFAELRFSVSCEVYQQGSLPWS